MAQAYDVRAAHGGQNRLDRERWLRRLRGGVVQTEHEAYLTMGGMRFPQKSLGHAWPDFELHQKAKELGLSPKALQQALRAYREKRLQNLASKPRA